MITIRPRIFVLLAVAFALLCPSLRSEQSQKAQRPAQEDRLKKLEDRTDAAEKAAAAAAVDKDYLTRTQKFYESYYQKMLNTQMWTIAIVGLLLTAVFVLVARFSLNLVDERIKLVTAEATVQMRNEYARAIAKEVQKLWDSNAADIKKLKESLAAHTTELDRNLTDRSEFQVQFVQALAAALEDQADSLSNFRNALRTYKSGKSRNLIDTKLGAITLRSVFESLRKSDAETCVEKARQELADSLYNGLDEELALAALQSPWLTPLINERIPPAPEPSPAPEPAAETHHLAPPREALHVESDLPFDEESDSCRLITT